MLILSLDVGVFGLCLGGVIGTVRNTSPILFALASGIQCSAIGASWCGKLQLLQDVETS